MRFFCRDYGFDVSDRYGKALRLAVMIYDGVSNAKKIETCAHDLICEEYILAYTDCLSQEPEYDSDDEQNESEASEAIDNCITATTVFEFKKRFAQHLSLRFKLKPNDTDQRNDVCERIEYGHGLMNWNHRSRSFFSSESNVAHTVAGGEVSFHALRIQKLG